MSEWLAKWRRIWALTRKETRQIIRDPSSIAIGGVVPVMMILLFGYGMSLDVTQVSVAVIDQDRSSDSAALIWCSIGRWTGYCRSPPISADAGMMVRQKSRFWSTARMRTRRASCKATPRDRSPYGARRSPDRRPIRRCQPQDAD